MDSFSDIKNELKEVRETAQKNNTAIRVLETTVVEKHISIIEKIEKLANDMERVVDINSKVSAKIEDELTYKIADLRTDLNDLKNTVKELSELANTTKASFRTIWIIVGIVASAIGLFSGFIPGLR